jgi:hypothetical protein
MVPATQEAEVGDLLSQEFETSLDPTARLHLKKRKKLLYG